MKYGELLLLFGKWLEGGPLFISPYCGLREFVVLALGIFASLGIARV